MDIQVLKALHTTIPREQLCEAYKASTGEEITLELVDQIIKPKKKQNILKIEKDLLDSYCEAVADMKKLKSELDTNKEISVKTFNAYTMLDEFIAKHTERIKDSGIWD